MSSYDIWLIPENGDGIPQKLEDWDGEDTLILRCIAFAKDVVIEVSPKPINNN